MQLKCAMTGEDWNRWAAIGQLAGAIGTFAAVITSLYLTLRAERPKLRLTAGVRLVIDVQAEGEFPKVIELTVRNAGSLTAHISQFGWQTGRWPLKSPAWLARQYAVQQPGELGAGTDPPYELPPGQRRSTILDFGNFLGWIRRKKGPPFFARAWPGLGVRRTSIWIVAFLESGVSIKARVEPDFADDLLQAEVQRMAGARRSQIVDGGEANDA
jgi:hypothetical protein